MNSYEFMVEDDNEPNPHERIGYIKYQSVPPHKPSKLQELCASKNIMKGDNVFVKENNDYQQCIFLRAGEKMLHVHNYITSQTESVDPKTVYIQKGLKYMPIIDTKKKVAEGFEDSQFPKFLGGYTPPFEAYSVEGKVLDSDNNIVLECKNPKFAKIVALALNQYVRNN